MSYCLFRVFEPYVLESRNWYVLPGEIVEGNVAVGMYVNIPIDSSQELAAQVDAVEFMRHEDSENVALCFKYAHEADLAIWQSLELADEDLIVTTDSLV